jgi:parvulin-like peptidyl-prolyl isomerase
MLQAITISQTDLLQQLQLSCQIPNLIEGIISRQIVTEAAQQAGIKIETEELQQAADQFRLIQQLQNADETWTWLQQHHLSLDDFETIVHTNLLSEKLAQHLFSDKVEPWFVEHQLDYWGAILYEIVLDDVDLAMELFYAIQEQEMTFSEVAHQYIQEPELRRKGGYRGLQYRQNLKPEISASIFASQPPQLLKPIITSEGVHLILVEEIVQPQLDEKLRSQIMSNLFSEWLKQQIAEVEIIQQLEASNLSSNS